MIFPERIRAYIYRILVVVAPVVTFYGIASEQEAILWLGVAQQVLGLGLAVVNTSTSTKVEVAPESDA